MVQFSGPHGSIDVAYLRHGGLHPPAEPPSQSFQGKTVVVTGCGSGIGFEAAKKIASLHPKKLILGTRTTEKGERVKSDILAAVSSIDPSTIEVIPVEHLSFPSVSQFTAAVKRKTQTLDCVLLSAGTALPSREVTEDGWPVTFKVNVLAPTLIALELLPLLRKTPGATLEFVNSISYCNVTSEDVAPLIQDPQLGALDYFNGEERWTRQRAYYEAKLMLMFVLQGMVEDLGSGAKSPVLLACCPGQCRTSLYRSFPLLVRVLMGAFNAFIARTAEQGSRTLVTGLLQDSQAHGKMWMNDTFDDRSPNMTEEEWNVVQKRVWREVVEVLKKHNPELEV